MIYWIVGLFGVAGALSRYYVSLWIGNWPGNGFPFATFMINLAGCWTLGWFLAKAERTPDMPEWLRFGFGTGFVGAFTTFSTFSVETLRLFQNGRPEMALLYVLLSLWAGLVAVWLGGLAGGPPRNFRQAKGGGGA